MRVRDHMPRPLREFLALLFGFEGRINRAQLLVGSLLSPFLLVQLLGLADFFLRMLPRETEAPLALAVLAAVTILAAWASLALMVKRCHDVGQSGWLVLVAMIPGAGALFTLGLYLYPGEPRDNVYGPPPGPGLRPSTTHDIEDWDYLESPSTR